MTVRRAAGLLLAALIAVSAYWLLHGAQQESTADQRLLNTAGQNSALAQLPAQQQVALGHEYCDLLAQHHGDIGQANARLSQRGSIFTADVLHTLRIAATVAYCPHL